jgi:hypothetical protein
MRSSRRRTRHSRCDDDTGSAITDDSRTRRADDELCSRRSAFVAGAPGYKIVLALSC